jgi:hypothetical protein
VILVVFDGQKDRALWIRIQRYISGRRTPELLAGGETLTVHIPVTSRFNSRAIRAIAQDKNVLQSRFQGEGHAHV